MKKGKPDRLSNLPDSVLVEILSLLNAREVVRTCVLSKRWINVWASVPCLDFNMANFYTENVPTDYSLLVPQSLAGDSRRFVEFVSRFLDLRDDCVNTDKFVIWYFVRCFFPPTQISHAAKRWMLYALNHKPKNLEITLKSTQEYLHLPECFFTCESLEEAYLNILDKKYGYKIEPNRVCLPNLRVLHLSNLKIEGEYMEKIISGCPILKCLSLNDCYLMMNGILFEKLEWLTIDGCVLRSDSEDPITFLISAPNLEYLKIVGEIEIGLKLKDMSKVKKAIIHSKDYVSNFDLLSSLSGVVDLKLCFFFCELGVMLENEISHSPTFHNLKILTLDGSCMFYNSQTMPSLLAQCPNLEELVLFHHEAGDGEDDHEEGIDEFLKKISALIESCCCEHLRVVDIRLGSDEGMRQVEQVVLHRTKGIDGFEVTKKTS